MIQSNRLKYIFPIGLLLFFSLDGILSHIFSANFFKHPDYINSNLVMIWMMMALFFEGDSNIKFIPISMVAGLSFDLYYTGILGINTFIYPLLVLMFRFFKPLTEKSAFLMSGIFVLSISLNASLIYIIMQFVNITHMTVGNFLLHSLIPTILFNLVVFIILYYPLMILFKKTRGANSRVL